jgi:hypothetical protein
MGFRFRRSVPEGGVCPHQRALAGLARAHDHDDGHRRQRSRRGVRRQPWQHPPIGRRQAGLSW